MARLARIVLPGYPHHVTQRGNRRQETFFCNDDYDFYLDLAFRFAREFSVKIEAYCLMPNHTHMILLPSNKTGMTNMVSNLHRWYTNTINQRNKWRGYLWQGRFYSVPLDESHFMNAISYVESNPVRANLVRSNEIWRWRSRNCTDLEETSKVNFDDIRKMTRTGRPTGTEEFYKIIEREVGIDVRLKPPGRKKKSEIRGHETY